MAGSALTEHGDFVGSSAAQDCRGLCKEFGVATWCLVCLREYEAKVCEVRREAPVRATVLGDTSSHAQQRDKLLYQTN